MKCFSSDELRPSLNVQSDSIRLQSSLQSFLIMLFLNAVIFIGLTYKINHYSVDGVVCFVNTYPLDSDLSDGQCYPAFEQPMRS